MVEGRSLKMHMLSPGSVVADRYEVVRSLSTGGMGTVYLVHDQRNQNAELALKVLHKEFSDDKQYVTRFLREVELMESVTHENVVAVHDFGTDGDLIFYVMDYVRGKSLEELLDRSTIPVPLLVKVMVGVVRGLRAIHAQEIIHRDLKPGNIIVCEDGTAKIVDFGVARPKKSRLTGINQRVGSVAYMAPEIWKNEQVTPAVDYYSLGVVLFECLTGEVPFEHSNPLKMMELHLTHVPSSTRERNKEVPGWLDALISNLLAKDTAKRGKTADEMLQVLEHHQSGDGDPEALKELLAAADTEKRKSIGDRLTEIFEIEDGNADAYRMSRSPTMILELTRTPSEDGPHVGDSPRIRRKTVVLHLPKQAALVFEIEPPSRDFIYLGVFFASLQVLDWVLTSMGMQRFGTKMEGNPLLQWLMEHYGPDFTLFVVKSSAIVMVAFITALAKHIKWIKNMIAFLSIVYLCAAIIPWIYFLFIQ